MVYILTRATSALVVKKRHSALNDNIKRALSPAGFNAVHEPVGLDHGDGKRRDDMTVFPFSMENCLICDATCVDSFPPQHWLLLQPSLDLHLAQQMYARTLIMKSYVIDTFFEQSPLNPLVCLDEIQMPSFSDWVTSSSSRKSAASKV